MDLRVPAVVAPDAHMAAIQVKNNLVATRQRVGMVRSFQVANRIVKCVEMKRVQPDH